MNFLGASFRLGRVFGIDVRVHILFLIYIGYRLISARGDAPAVAIFMGVLFGIVLMHEFGHCFGARAVGGDARDILMWPLGGLAYAHAPMRPWPQFVTVACGPLVNLLFCLVSGIIVLQQTHDIQDVLLNPFEGIMLPSRINWVGAVWIFYQINLMLLAFNLLPIYPLDGGQLFHAIIWPLVGLQRATFIACYVGIAGCIALGVWGLAGSGGEMLFFIAIFGGFTCFQRLQAARYGMIVEDSGFQPYGDTGRYAQRRGFWSRLWGGCRRSAPVEPGAHPYGRPSPNPNPGAWEAKLAERDHEEAELDRILKKVSEQGIHSLSYVERQTLERVTRQRQQAEREFERRSHT